MRLIGVVTGTYEGNNWAKLIFTESMPEGKGIGQNAIISKAQYNFVQYVLLPQIDLFLNQDVRVYYDRFGKVSTLELDVPR